jgi:hypothetical protein
MSGQEQDTLTPDDMRNWLRQEVSELSKAMELRVQDATDFVTAYALGKLTPAQAQARLNRYQDRWGDEVIPGVSTDERMTNAEIIERLDQALASEAERIHGRRLTNIRDPRRSR